MATYGLMVVGALVMAFPFLWLVRSSLMTDRQLFAVPVQWVPNPLQLSNYSDALTSRPFGRYFLNSFLIEAVSVPGTVLTAALAAFAFARLRWPGRDRIFWLLFASIVVPHLATIIPTFLIWRSLGGIGTYAPIIVPSWLGGGVFNIFLLRQFFLTIPLDLDEAAYIDGASPLRVFWQVILPLSRPALIVVAVLEFIRLWSDFLTPTVYLNEPLTFTVSQGLAFFRDEYTGRWADLMAASTAVMIPLLVVFFFGQKYIMTGITVGGRD